MTQTSNEIITVNVPDKTELLASAQSKLNSIEAFDIDCKAVYEIAAEELKVIKAEAKKLEGMRTDLVKPLNDETKRINGIFKEATEILDKAEKAIKAKMLAFNEAQEAFAKERQRKLDAAAEVERKRLEYEAKKAEETGDTATAEALALTAQVVTSPIVQANTAKVSGVSTRSTWKAEVTDLHALIKHVAKNQERLNLIAADTKAINQLAKALKANMNIPGVRVFEDKTIASKAF